MTSYLTNFVHRLQLEQGYALLADVDEEGLRRNQQRWEKALDELAAQPDQAKHAELLDALLRETGREQDVWRPAGGPFPCPLGNGRIGGEQLIALPPLLELQPYFARILVKLTPLVVKIVLIADGQLAEGIDRQRLLAVGERLKKEFGDDEPEAPAKRFSLFRRLRPPKLNIIFDLVVLGNHVLRPLLRERLKRLKVSINPRTYVFIRCHLLDTGSKRIWSTLPRLHWGQRRDLAYAVKHCHHDAAAIRRHIETTRLHWGLVAFMVALGFALLTGGYAALGRVLDGQLLGLWTIIAPLIALGVGISLPRLKHNLGKQVDYFLWSYLTIFVGIWLLLRWPPGVLEALGFGITTFLIYAVCKTIGAMAELG